MFSCLIEAVSDSLSADEKPAPSERLPVGFSLTVIVRSTWSARARHLVGLDVDLAEVAEPVDPVARELDLAAVVPGRLELAELAPHDLVAGARVAGDVDAAHVDAALRLGDQRHDHLAVGAVDLGPRVDLGEGVAEGAEAVDEGARRLGDRLGAIRLARPDRHQRLELVLLAEVLALELDRRSPCRAGLP